jgi:hypothetical protein
MLEFKLLVIATSEKNDEVLDEQSRQVSERSMSLVSKSKATASVPEDTLPEPPD